MRYTNSLPSIASNHGPSIPSHLRKSIDRLGSGITDPPRISLGEERFTKPKVIEYYESQTPQANETASEIDQEEILTEGGFISNEFYKREVRDLEETGKGEILYEEMEDNLFLEGDSDGYMGDRVETFHLEDLTSQIIEEKAEEDETTTNQMITNKEFEKFSSNADVESEDDIKIMDEASVSRRSINSSLINIKKTKVFGRKSDL